MPGSAFDRCHSCWPEQGVIETKGLPRLPLSYTFKPRLIYMRIATHGILDCERTDHQSAVSVQITRTPTRRPCFLVDQEGIVSMSLGVGISIMGVYSLNSTPESPTPTNGAGHGQKCKSPRDKPCIDSVQRFCDPNAYVKPSFILTLIQRRAPQ